jgi:hypothetical protein
MEARWPMFHRALLEQTPFRSVASIPLRSDDLRRFGALDLYSANLETLTALSMDEVSTDIAEPIAAILFDAPTDTIQHGIPLPLWLNNRSVTHRMNVWVAVGILIEHANVTNADALAALRAYAYGHDTTLDDVADLVSSQRLRPAALLT